MSQTTALDLQALDLTVLDELAQLQVTRQTLTERLKHMDERRSEVPAPVFLRVRADYEQQRSRLELDERPKKKSAKEIYAKLRSRLDALEQADAEAKLNLQELEFRHSLGEFDKAQFNVRKADIDAGIQERAADFETAKLIRERFLAVFESEVELNANSDAAAPAPTPPSAPQPTPPVAPPSNYTPIPQAAPAQIPGMPPVPTDAPPPPAPVSESKPEIKRPANPDATVVFRPGRLTPMNPEAGIAPTMLSLKPISIGTDPTCDVKLNAANVQRRHVDINLTRAGFMLKDVAGGGFVYIDGQVVTEQLLRDGDSVQIGSARFAFKLA